MNRSYVRLTAFAACCVFLFGATTVLAQRKTIILVRHAEKDTSATADQNDPVLTPQGIERTRRLAEKIGRYRPGAVYSTDYKRTRDTASPIAQKRRKEIQIYDARKPQELIERIMQSTTKRFVIVGHSNTIPPLANLIMKKEVFKNLDDPEHSVIWLIRIKNGKAIKVELLDY